MTGAAPDASFPSAARWVCVAVLGGLGAIGVARGVLHPERPTIAEQPKLETIIPSELPESVRVETRPLQTLRVDPDPSAPEPESAPASGIQKLINVNTATAAELELLPGIGPVMAQRIIDDRATNGPYRTPADLDRVKGIGPKTLEKLTPLVRVN